MMILDSGLLFWPPCISQNVKDIRLINIEIII